MWSSALKGCGQAVCRKKGSKAVWQVCPSPATKEDLQRLEDSFKKTTMEDLQKVEDSLKKTEENVLKSLKELEKKFENICDDKWHTTLDTTPSPPTTLPYPLLDCPEQWMKFGSNCYRYFEGDKANWTDAEFECHQNPILAKAHLASIHSAEEQKFVLGNFPINIWLGGSDVDEEGSWVWKDGSEWDYSAWRENEPSNSGSGEHCLAISADGWNDYDCSASVGFLCKAPRLPLIFFG